jgi:hypothetical protein
MNLLETQRRFREWLVAESAESAAALGDGAAPGLAVHLNTYRGQLLACLAETYGSVRAWLGATAFEAAAAIHVERVPPSSWTLDDYARDFPQTLRDLYPQDPEVHELAGLERTLAEIFIAQDCTPLTPDAVDPTAWAQIDWDCAQLKFVPTLQLVSLTTNAVAIWSALSNGQQPPACAALPAPAPLLLWRRGYATRFRALEPAEADALERLRAGLTFGALCSLLVDRHGAAEGPQRAAGWLGQWLRDELILTIV